MPLTRKFLKALGIEDDKIEQIIESHIDTVDGLKKDLETYKEKAESVEQITKERDTLQDKLDKMPDAETVRTEFEAYKAKIEGEAKTSKINEKVTAKLKAVGFNDSVIGLLLKDDNLSGLDLDEKGEVVGIDEKAEILKSAYPQFIAQIQTNPTVVPNTPPNPQSPAPTDLKSALAEKYK